MLRLLLRWPGSLNLQTYNVGNVIVFERQSLDRSMDALDVFHTIGD